MSNLLTIHATYSLMIKRGTLFTISRNKETISNVASFYAGKISLYDGSLTVWTSQMAHPIPKRPRMRKEENVRKRKEQETFG